MVEKLGEGENTLDNPALELASRQASLAFQRTLMSVDMSLLSAIRTSLSLIGFGFATVLFFHQLSPETGISLAVPARNFGLSLVAMGVGLVAVGLVGHRRSFAALRNEMNELHRRNLLVRGLPRRVEPIAVFALLLLFAGLLVILGIVVRIDPFG